jgi:hypothetical protein
VWATFPGSLIVHADGTIPGVTEELTVATAERFRLNNDRNTNL